jgi:prepilin-type processing-associated H-X9-DG protein
LPYLEQENLYKKFNVANITGTRGGQLFNGQPGYLNPNLLFNNPPNNTNVSDLTLNPAATPLKIYQCPSSPSQGMVYQDVWDNNPNAYGPMLFSNSAVTSYTLSASDYAGLSMLGRFHRGIPIPTGDGILNDDIDGYNITRITDGSSNTVVVGEMAGGPDVYITGHVLYSSHTSWDANYPSNSSWYTSGTAWADGNNGNNWLAGSDSDGGVASGNPLSGGPCSMNCNNIQNIYSFHPGGANFLFADGHVQFLAQTIDRATLAFLICPVDGQVIDGSQF